MIQYTRVLLKLPMEEVDFLDNLFRLIIHVKFDRVLT